MLIQCGCGKTHQIDKVKTYGFLRDYSQLEKGGKGEEQLLYISPNANFKAYDKILMESIKVYLEEGGNIGVRTATANAINFTVDGREVV